MVWSPQHWNLLTWMDPVTRTTLAHGSLEPRGVGSLALDLVEQEGCKELGAIYDRHRATMVSWSPVSILDMYNASLSQLTLKSFLCQQADEAGHLLLWVQSMLMLSESLPPLPHPKKSWLIYWPSNWKQKQTPKYQQKTNKRTMKGSAEDTVCDTSLL